MHSWLTPLLITPEETFDKVYEGLFDVEATRPGYDFKGWTLVRNGDVLTANDLVSLAKDTTVYAKWQPKKYNVKFVMKGFCNAGHLRPETLAFMMQMQTPGLSRLTLTRFMAPCRYRPRLMLSIMAGWQQQQTGKRSTTRSSSSCRSTPTTRTMMVSP